MRRDHSTSPFDVEAEEAGDITQQFWGSSRGWISHRQSVVDDRSSGYAADDDWSSEETGSLQAIRRAVGAFRPRRITGADPTGQVERTRQHGVVQPRRTHQARGVSLGELAAGGFDPDDGYDTLLGIDRSTQPRPVIDNEHDMVPLSSARWPNDRVGLGGVDPLLARIGMMILIVVLLVPIALALRPGSDRPLTETLTAGVTPNFAGVHDLPAVARFQEAAPETAPADQSADQPLAATDTTDPEPASTDVTGTGDETTAPSQSADVSTSSTVGDDVEAAQAAQVQVATVSEIAERNVPACPTTYVAGAGDSWYRIADAAGVTPNALLDENRATVKTVIFPGDDICLPAGATMPTQPTTTTAAPTTNAPTTNAPTTNAPATTQPPSTTPATPSQVEQLIRDIWPDELEEKALQIAWRESKYRPEVYNGWCCYGVFQIYWSVHVSWLDEYGIYSSADLLDARKNITAAYAMYQRAGGWGPWDG